MFFTFNTHKDYKYQIRKNNVKLRVESKYLNYSELSKNEATDVNIITFEKSFKEKYNKMKDSLKWKLKCTEYVIEDIILDFTFKQ